MSNDLVTFLQGLSFGVIVSIMFILLKGETMVKSKDIQDKRGKRRNTTAAKVRRWLKTHVLRIRK